MLVAVHHRDDVAHRDLAGHVVAQQGLDGVFADQHAGKPIAVHQRDLDLEDRGALGLISGGE